MIGDHHRRAAGTATLLLTALDGIFGTHSYNHTARPFNWKFTADDLTALLHRISQPEQTASQQAALSQAA
jgi:hypothetical protein